MDVEELIRISTDTWNDRDRDGYLAVYTEDCEVSGPGFALKGHDGLAEWWAQYMSAFPDNRIVVTRTITDESTGFVVEESVIEGTHRGPLDTGDGSSIPATGRHVSVPFCMVHRTQDGRLVASRLYYDQVELLAQLGVM